MFLQTQKKKLVLEKGLIYPLPFLSSFFEGGYCGIEWEIMKFPLSMTIPFYSTADHRIFDLALSGHL